MPTIKNVKASKVETVSPSNYALDNKAKTINWTFKSVEPTVENDIYIRYFNSRERRQWEHFKKRKAKGRI
jgi:hypothetical protein